MNFIKQRKKGKGKIQKEKEDEEDTWNLWRYALTVGNSFFRHRSRQTGKPLLRENVLKSRYVY